MKPTLRKLIFSFINAWTNRNMEKNQNEKARFNSFAPEYNYAIGSPVTKIQNCQKREKKNLTSDSRKRRKVLKSLQFRSKEQMERFKKTRKKVREEENKDPRRHHSGDNYLCHVCRWWMNKNEASFVVDWGGKRRRSTHGYLSKTITLFNVFF